MIVELDRGQEDIEWECNNGGVQFNATTSDLSTSTSTTTLPSAFCTSGFATLRALFIISLLIDLTFQVEPICIQLFRPLTMFPVVLRFPQLAVLQAA